MLLLSQKKQRGWNKRGAGFTLLEMLFALAISITISSVVLYNHRQFSEQFIITGLAQRVALAIREAQVFGLGVREFELGGLSSFSMPYGIHFSLSEPRTFFLFADRNANTRYDVALDTVIETFTLERGHSIARLCSSDGVNLNCTISALTITFKRPDPEATIRDNTGGPRVSGRVDLASPSRKERSVEVTLSGQISLP
jgi:prepilin-type N-terminal cleavage/methylation domain-containing protein